MCRGTVFIRALSWVCAVAVCGPLCSQAVSTAASWDPAASDYTGRKGVTLSVSKLGDNSDGTSWQKAFHTLQAVMDAIPDDRGGHSIVVRPDRYVEANILILPVCTGIRSGPPDRLASIFPIRPRAAYTRICSTSKKCPKESSVTDSGLPNCFSRWPRHTPYPADQNHRCAGFPLTIVCHGVAGGPVERLFVSVACPTS